MNLANMGNMDFSLFTIHFYFYFSNVLLQITNSIK